MKEFIKILEKCPLFYDIESSNLLKMLECLQATVESFDKKYTVMAEGSEAKYIGIVLDGSVQISQSDIYGNRSIISSAQAGELFAESFACAMTELPINVIAAEPSKIMLIKSSHILHTCTNNCQFHQRLIFNLMKDVSTKNIQFHRRMEILAKRSTAEKLEAYLASQAKLNGKSSFYIPFDRQELADYLAVDRSGLSVQISKLIERGVIRSSKNYFELLQK